MNQAFPFIAATPDGKIYENGQSGILEIKCPFSVRDTTIAEVLADIQEQDFFLQINDKNIELRQNHMHWFQVQVSCWSQFCDFVTYTRQDMKIVRVLPHKPTNENILSKMLTVYCKFVCKKQSFKVYLV